jgi:hypothetical protein
MLSLQLSLLRVSLLVESINALLKDGNFSPEACSPEVQIKFQTPSVPVNGNATQETVVAPARVIEPLARFYTLPKMVIPSSLVRDHELPFR